MFIYIILNQQKQNKVCLIQKNYYFLGDHCFVYEHDTTKNEIS